MLLTPPTADNISNLSTPASTAFLAAAAANGIGTGSTALSMPQTPMGIKVPGGAAAAMNSGTPLQSPATAASSTNATSPISRKRPRDVLSPSDSADGDHSPTGGWDGSAGGHESRIGVKRACNECRQQKLKCNVQQDPFVTCERCRKHKIPCRIDANFKRVGKRKKNAEMEQENARMSDDLDRAGRENAELRRQIASMQQSGYAGGSGIQGRLAMQNGTELKFPVPNRVSAVNDLLGTTEAIDSLLELRGGGSSPAPTARSMYKLHGFSLTPDRVDELFEIFFANYHPYLPLMNKDRGPKFFHTQCPLLFWSMMATAMRKCNTPELLFHLDPHLQKLLWATISDVKQHYLVVKALATLCTWPLPVTSSNADPTPMLCGVMVQLAKQIGLHRPTQAQDFERFKIEMRDDELRDRYYTWAACNIVGQRVSTGYGLPPNTLYDWVLTEGEGKEVSFTLSPEVNARLKIEMFCDDVTRNVYSDPDTPLGFVTDDKKKQVMDRLDGQLDALMREIGQEHSVNRLYLLAARLHYRLAALFERSSALDYRHYLDQLWVATVEFVDAACNVTSPLSGNIIAYATSYVFQMLLTAGFVLLKLLNGFYASSVDRERGRGLFSAVVRATRLISVMTNDLPSRFSEVLSQLWQLGGRGVKPVGELIDDSLQLKVRGRMSMSLVHDSVWRWKEISHVEDDSQARDAALNQRTLPDTAPVDISSAAAAAAAASSTAASASIFDNPRGLQVPGAVAMRRSPTPIGTGWGDEFNNDIFDPASWVLDGHIEFPLYDNSDLFANAVS